VKALLGALFETTSVGLFAENGKGGLE